MALKKVKLIRDKLEPSGPVTCRPVPSVAIHAALLVAKMHEEVGEVADHLTDASEYADVLQALMDLAALCGVTWRSVELEQALKHNERGGFSGGKVMVVRGEA